jgi:hypothetical protein
MEPGADLQQAADPPLDEDFADGRLRDAGEDLEQGALARPVAPDETRTSP